MFFSKRITKDAVFLIGIGLLFFILRFPSLYEPYWYGDEGIYFIIAKALHAGQTLYVDIWDNKPPMLYWFYFLFSDIFAIRFVSLLFGILTTISFFILSTKLFRHAYVRYLTTAGFALFLALPTIEGNIANAENFMLLPITVAVILFLKAIPNVLDNTTTKIQTTKTKHYFLATGILLGIAFLFKTVAMFDFAAICTTLLFVTTPHLQKKQLLIAAKNQILPLALGFIIPLGVVAILMAMQGALPAFFSSIFLKNVSYVGENNVFLIPQGFLILKLLSLIIGLFTLYILRHKISQKMLFILVWLAFSLFSAFFSQRPYTHYMLVVIPALALLIGLMLDTNARREKLVAGAIAGLAVIILITMFPYWNGVKTLTYYENFLLFVSNKRSVTDYQTFFDWNTPRDYAVADYLRLHTKPNDRIFLWGNSAQIYYLSDTLPAGRYAVAYHITTPESIAETAQMLESSAPEFLVILPGTETLPVSIPHYGYRLTIGDAKIYERLF